MLIILLRQRLLPWIELYISRSDRDAIMVNGHDADVLQLRRNLDVAISWQTQDGKSWLIGGKLCGVLQSNEAKFYDVVALKKSFSWSIVPWGADFTGLMIAFVSDDDRLLAKAELELNEMGCADLIVSEYGSTDNLNEEFKGFVFGRAKEHQGRGIWPYICGENDSVLAFSRGGLPRALMEATEIIGMETSDQMYGRGVCLRVNDEEEFLKLARQQVELIISDHKAKTYMTIAIANFNSLQLDPLAFAIKHFGDAKVIYLPGTAHRHSEIVFCRNGFDAKAIWRSEQLQASNMLELACYC